MTPAGGWNPPLAIGGTPRMIKVSATDVASTSACGRHLALKTRKVTSVDGWSRSFAPYGQDPFPLGDVIDLVALAHDGPGLDDYPAHTRWLDDQMRARGTHRLVRDYLIRAVDNVLEVHEEIEAELGPLRLVVLHPQIGSGDTILTAWGPLYEAGDGTREIRRVRVGAVRDEDDRLWTATAANVAANHRDRFSRRVRVVEVGPLDGSHTVLFDGSADEARALYATTARTRARAVTEADHVVPCHSCGTCKAAGSCAALVPADGFLGQATAGHKSRAVSPSSLAKHATCPAMWLMETELHLPRTGGDSPGAARGRAVHLWLEAAHRRGVGCRPEDLSDAGGGTSLGLADGVLTHDEYRTAHPYLVHHPAVCPLNDTGIAQVVHVEETIHSFDRTAEVLPTAKPDLVYRDADTLVVRELKTSEHPYLGGRDEAFDKHLQVPFLLRLLQTGLLAHHRATVGVVEVEVLTPDGAEVYTWRTDSPGVMAVAAEEVERVAGPWHTDAIWPTRPGPHCGWCPVREWCPDRDAWESRAAAEGPHADPAVPEDEPPF